MLKLCASNGAALAVLKSFLGGAHFKGYEIVGLIAVAKLLTDVLMPGLRGPELARQVAELHPGIHLVYMSGFASGFLDSPIPADTGFLQRPFRLATLGEQLKLVPRKV